jgi:hypothetical protein
MKKIFPKIIILLILVSTLLVPLSGVNIHQAYAQGNPPDTDGDGIPDPTDPDDDGDGTPDVDDPDHILNSPWEEVGEEADDVDYVPPPLPSGTVNIKIPDADGYDLKCNLIDSVVKVVTFGLVGEDGSVAGCIAQFVYTIWEVSAWIATGAGKFLDFFIFYSIDDNSYRNGFIEGGWGIVRDICNVFFILALLYVAIKTILGLNVSDNKKLIAYIVIIALLINFSLFATKVVIDMSNVLAKIFYAGIESKDTDKKPAIEKGGEKSISVGLVRKYNPQTIISKDIYNAPKGIGMFIFTTIMLIAMTLYTAWVFFQVAIVFLGRVVGLWLSMIFSPIAFASHTVPFKIPGFGHQEWWPDLFKMAFLAPIFVFFLYMIVKFLNVGLDIAYKTGEGLEPLQHIMAAVIPMCVIFILLMKAKDIAVKMSGEIGAGVMSAFKMAGGVAGGMALGAAAFGGKQIFGRLGHAIANNSSVKSWAASSKIGSAFQKGAMKMESGSFDLRQVKIKGKGLDSLTGMDLGKGKTGGFKGEREERVKRRQKRAEELKVGEDEGLTQNLHREEAALQGQLDVSHGALEDIEKRLEGALKASSAAAAAARYDPTKEQDARNAAQKVNDLRQIKEAIKKSNGRGAGNAILANVIRRGGASQTLANEFANHVNNAEVAAMRNGRRSIDHMEDEVIRDAKNAIHHETRRRMNNFADRNNSTMSNIFTVLGGGSWKANREASHKIRMDVKLDSSGKPGH